MIHQPLDQPRAALLGEDEEALDPPVLSTAEVAPLLHRRHAPDGPAVAFRDPVSGPRPVAEGSVDAAPDRRQGRILFRGPSAFKGYYRNAEATAKVKLDDGWVDSGDLGYMVAGELFISGRVKDLIIKGGRNYYPHELEAAAGAVAGVRQGCVAAFAIRDDEQPAGRSPAASRPDFCDVGRAGSCMV